MTEKDLLTWYHANVSQYAKQALQSTPDTIYNEALLIGLSCREVSPILYPMIRTGHTLQQILPHLIGDSGNGYGLTQIDKGSYLPFIEAGDWKDPLKCFIKTIEVLETMRKRLNVYHSIAPANMLAAIVASYNTGAGNIIKALQKGLPIDTYTYNHDYSADVLRLAAEYDILIVGHS